MSFFESKQIIHIAAECAVIVVVTFYFSLKHRQLVAKVSTLSQRIKEQELLIQKHEKLLQNHDKIFRNLLNQQATTSPPSTPPTPPPSPSQPKSPEKTVLPAPSEPTVQVIEKELKEELDELTNADLKSKNQEKKQDE